MDYQMTWDYFILIIGSMWTMWSLGRAQTEELVQDPDDFTTGLGFE
jgi:hypothetical protein